jgi:hypothetical protein
VRIGGRRVSAVVGSARFTLRAGQRRTITVKLVPGLRSIVRGRTLRVNAQTVTSDAGKSVAVGTKRLTLRFPRR